MRYSQIISDLTDISFATIFHHAGPADDFQVGDLCQFGQNVVLYTIDECHAFLLLAQIWKGQNAVSTCYWLPNQFTLPNDPARCRSQSDQGCCQERADWIAPHPFLPASENTSVSRLNRLML